MSVTACSIKTSQPTRKSRTQIVVIDNLRRRLDSAALSSALTARVWEDRFLGTSRNVTPPVRCMWAATGNNPAVSSEIARRTVSIRIDPKMERPWERTAFLHVPLTGWVLAHRQELVRAVLTLARAWDRAGRPKGKASLGSFEDWAGVVGGILGEAGVEGFLANRARFYDRADRETAAWSVFIGAWAERWGGEETVGVKDLWALLDEVEPPVDLGQGSERSQRIRLGDALARVVDRRFLVDGQTRRLESAGTRKRAAIYRLACG